MNKSKGFKLGKENFMKGIFALAAFTAVVAVGFICFFLFFGGLPALFDEGVLNVLFGTDWKPSDGIPLYGLLPMILGSVYVTVGAILIGVPVGVLAAMFMAKICPKYLYRIFKPLINLLAGVPSVVYGFFGVIVILPQIQKIFDLNSGASMIAASILLGIMILPTIIAVTESSIRAVPNEYYEGAVALGATHERAIFRVVLPAAKSGVMAAVALGIGRAIGETMAVIMVAGNHTAVRLPWQVTDGVRTLTANVVLEMAYSSGRHREMLIASGVVLFIFVLALNLIFNVVVRRGEGKVSNKARKGPSTGLVVGAIAGAIIGMVVVPNIGVVPDFSEKRGVIESVTLNNGTVASGSEISAQVTDGRLGRVQYQGSTVTVSSVVIDGTVITGRNIEEIIPGIANGYLKAGEVRNITFQGMYIDVIIGILIGAFLAALLGKSMPDWLLKILTWAAGFLTFIALAFIIGYILIMGIPHLSPELFAIRWTPSNASMLPSIINTGALVFFTLLFAIPLGVFSAIFLVEYAKRGNKFVKLIRTTTETLAGIPSIVYGLFGMIFFVTVLGWGYSLLAGACTLSIMVLPIIMRTTEEALKSVPDTYREGSFGLGAGRLRTVFRIVLPAAMPGILAGIILSVGRIAGETAALMFTAGMFEQIFQTPLSSARTLAVHMYILGNDGLYTEQAYATAVILLVVVIVINMISSLLARKMSAVKI